MTWSSLLKALTITGLFLGVVMGPYAVGVHNGAASEKAKCLKASSTDQAQAITALQAELKLAWQQLRDQQHTAVADAAKQRDLEQQLAAARASTRVVYRTIRKEIPHASLDVAAPAPSELAVPSDRPGGAGAAGGLAGAGCPFGGAFVRVWDAAIDPAGAAAGGPAGLPDTAAFAAAPPSGADPAAAVTAEQLLSNHIDNAELSTEARDALNALIDWHLHNDLQGLPDE